MATTNLSSASANPLSRESTPQAKPRSAKRPQLRLVPTQNTIPTETIQRNPALGLAIGLGTGLAFWGSLALLVLL